MNLRLLLASAALLALGGTSHGQTAAPDPGGQALTPAQQANRDRVKGERDACRAEAQGRGLKGPAVRDAVMDCMGKADPAAAKRMGCAQAARAKGLAGDELRTSVRACMTAAG